MTTHHGMTRRNFTAQMALAGAALLVPQPSIAADEKPTAVNFGFTLYGMRKLPITEAIQVCADIGYGSVELACMADWPGAPEVLSKALRIEIINRLQNTGIEVASLMENLSPLAEAKIHEANLERLKRTFELGHDLSPNSTPVVETVLGGKPAEWEQVKGRMVERLHDWARIAEAGKTTIALKPHVGGALHSPEGAQWLMEQLSSPWLKLAYDFSHFELRGRVLTETLDLMLPQTAFIHVKDTQGDASKFQFLLPGDGKTDYLTYFRYLKQKSYSGPIVVEVSGQLHSRADYDAVAAAKKSYAKLAPILAETGLWKPKGTPRS